MKLPVLRNPEKILARTRQEGLDLLYQTTPIHGPKSWLVKGDERVAIVAFEAGLTIRFNTPIQKTQIPSPRYSETLRYALQPDQKP